MPIKFVFKIRFLFFLVVLILLSESCQKINSVFKTKSPREIYKKKIDDSPIASKSIVKRWIIAGDSVLHHPVYTTIPFKTKMVYFSDEANAWAWQFPLPKGRTLCAHLSRSDTTTKMFMDLYVAENGKQILQKSAEDSIISYEADQDQTMILRIQAELIVDGSSTLTLTDRPSMAFPVKGGNRADIGGIFGDPRDGGARKHKGVDIFANRGTPALAVADGWVTRTGNHGLGGKQVWLRANGKSIYYAHLDSINSHTGQKAQAGDTLGFVGNTGNARTSPPHLHFGIYEHGAINPLPFIDFTKPKIEPVTADPEFFSKWGRIAAGKANVRPRPSTQRAPVQSLKNGNPVLITGGTGHWYQIMLPNRSTGFIYRTLIEPADASSKTKILKTSDQLFAQFDNQMPRFSPDSTTRFSVYGRYKNRLLTKYRDHWVWVDK